jgi:hypothetical protein
MEYGTHSMRRTKATLIYRRTRDLRAVQLLPGHSKLESTVRYLDTEVEDALEISEQTEIRRCRRRPPWKLRQGGRPKRPQCGAGPNWYFRPEADLGGVPAETASGCLQSLNSRLPMTANAHGSHWSATSTKVRSKPRSSHWTDMYFE